jgi:hypothetical protein
VHPVAYAPDATRPAEWRFCWSSICGSQPRSAGAPAPASMRPCCAGRVHATVAVAARRWAARGVSIMSLPSAAADGVQGPAVDDRAAGMLVLGYGGRNLTSPRRPRWPKATSTGPMAPSWLATARAASGEKPAVRPASKRKNKQQAVTLKPSRLSDSCPTVGRRCSAPDSQSIPPPRQAGVTLTLDYVIALIDLELRVDGGRARGAGGRHRPVRLRKVASAG